MKKYIIGILLLVSLAIVFGPTEQVSAARFNKGEATALVCDGTWVDTNSGKKVTFRKESTVIYEKGYTDPTGESLIYFGSKGADFKMAVTYYPDQKKYYANIVCNMYGKGYETFSECSVRE